MNVQSDWGCACCDNAVFV